MNIKLICKRIISNIRIYRKNKTNRRDKLTWIFGEWFGKKCSDNVLAFANYVARNGDKQLKLYWLCNNDVDTSNLDRRVNVVDRNSSESLELQKHAGVAIMNQGYGDFNDSGDNYLGNAITINLWHGVMWKRIGYDSFSNSLLSKIYIRIICKTKRYSLYCSPSEIYEKLFAKAFKMGTDQSVKIGLPRNELFFYSNKIKVARERVIESIRKINNNVNSSSKIITYMPTFRDKTDESFSFEALDIKALDDFLDSNNCFIVQKAHEVNMRRNTGYGESTQKRIINIDTIAPQELLAATDVLITDYSSCLFDYLLLDRPIIQFLYDYDYYSKKDRGLYYSFKSVDCGAVVKDEKELVKAIKESITNPEKNSKERSAVRKKFMTYEGPDNCSVIYQRILDLLNFNR